MVPPKTRSLAPFAWRSAPTALLGIGELLDPFAHQRLFRDARGSPCINVGEHLGWRELIHLAGDGDAAGLHRIIG